MSQQAHTAKVVAAYTNFLRGNYCSLAARVLFLWDYVVTLGDEIHLVWERKFTSATFLFLVNRYLNLLITVMELMEQAPFQTAQVGALRYRFELFNLRKLRSCGPFIRVLQSLLILALFVVAAFASLRVYATWDRDWKVTLPVLLLALVSPALNIMINVGQIPIPAPAPSVGCAANLRLPELLYSNLIIINRSTTSAYDAVVLVLTIIRAIRLQRQASRLDMSSGLTGLLLRDGTVYFASLLAINLAQIIITSRVTGSNYLSYFVSPFTSILISRFLLDLRQVNRGNARFDAATVSMFTSELSPMDFEDRGLSTFGASLWGPDSLYTVDTATNTDEHEGDKAMGPIVAEPQASSAPIVISSRV